MHKLLIKSSFWTHGPREIRDILRRDETLRSTDTGVYVEITNIGEDPFTGGVINRFTVDSAQFSMSRYLLANAKIPELKSQGKVSLNLGIIDIPYEGSAWLVLQMTANDKGPIETYQSLGSYPNPPNEWKDGCFIISKELFNINLLLQQIAKPKSIKTEDKKTKSEVSGK